MRGTELPFWDYYGSTVISQETVRLTPPTAQRVGGLWNQKKVQRDAWDVELEFRAGGGGRVGAEGFAMWFVDPKSTEGNQDDQSVFGFRNKWTGLAIVFDTYDNDNDRTNPSIAAWLNDGTQVFDHDADGGNAVLKLGQCSSNYRNPYRNSKLRVTYENGMLTVDIDALVTDNYVTCFGPVPVKLPQGYRFGFTAKTGSLYDFHDLYSFVFNSREEKEDKRKDDDDKKKKDDDDDDDKKKKKKKKDKKIQLDANGDAIADKDGKGDAPADEVDNGKGDDAAASAAAADDDDKSADDADRKKPKRLRVLDNIEQLEAKRDLQAAAAAQATATAGGVAVGLSLDDIRGAVQAELKGQFGEMRSELLQQLTKSLAAQLTPLAEAVNKLHANVQQVAQKSGEPHPLEDDIKQLHAAVQQVAARDVEGTVESLRRDVRGIQDLSQRSSEEVLKKQMDLHAKVEASSTFGFWSYFVFFQAFFAVAFVLWKMQRDSAQKKLF